MNLFEAIGESLIRSIITDFYDIAFEDPIIGHFFFEKDKSDLINKQFGFTSRLLGGPYPYQGKPLASIHKPLHIRLPHFMRRQMIFQQVLKKSGVDDTLALKWLEKENELKHLIVS